MTVKSTELVRTVFSKGEYPPPLRREIAFAGRSNVGKSSLLNSLFGRKLAKTSSTPGKTRSINFYGVNREIYFVDLPGYGYAKASMTEREKWKKLIIDYFESREELSLVVVLVDIRHPLQPADIQMLEWVTYYAIPFILVLTKADKLSRSQQIIAEKSIKAELASLGVYPPVFVVSAVKKQGIEKLLIALL
ncbi:MULTISPECIES: ribosome biogenesis GTP-binding protein YihA/YsxC [Mesotoga]|uniref:ribosome biogenesis GTP-binding protein YihA/YsxC n=2 Tax=Kosmotogaceae TaxID=1643948 RepID=UPI0002CA30CB|nr:MULTISPECIES: ribosome biogenesis GTP-binding protein YihA/YsxC [Mesotoga]MCP5456882.1 YihA family ribosome biogenesis GTP-binding protein [Thermotogota bacterium]CCU86020.1 putative GTP-binding protein EngB [Mesotoga infera]MCP5461059.1 YihA family ribosome biogenesis GTP-binding protein [Thermotogota bacterium]MDI9368318.1 ribosome biogenesis GTP-binding protein YihA/YsxC [Thermotogota bacterium]RLL87837.1 GTP-binding protein [Mesotoga sp. H07pep.5.4]